MNEKRHFHFLTLWDELPKSEEDTTHPLAGNSHHGLSVCQPQASTRPSLPYPSGAGPLESYVCFGQVASPLLLFL